MILSICIPSYNRFGRIKEILYSLNKCKSKEFEVVIVDNGSAEDIYEYIIPEKYSVLVRIIKRNSIVDGITNTRDCINYGKGRFRMLCLDKDFIEGIYLEEFINFLINNQNIAGGYCKLNITSCNKPNYYSRNMFSSRAYRINHPSGTFVRKDIIIEDNEAVDYVSPDSIYKEFSFLFDLLIARCILRGRLAVYNSPLVKTETEDEAQRKKTYSYDEDNLYFLPVNKRKQLHVYLKNLNSYELAENEYKKTSFHIFKQLMVDSSLGYMNIMKNKKICSHYGISPKNIDRNEAISEGCRCKEEIERSEDCYMRKIDKKLYTAIIMAHIWMKLLLKKK